MVILTSGTTGPPKGARIARASGLEPLAWYLSVVPIDAGSRCLIPAPLFHAHGLGQFTIATRARVHGRAPADVRRRGDPRPDRASSDRGDGGGPDDAEVASWTSIPPPARRYETSSLRVVVCSGSALDARLARSFMEEFGPVLYNLYGSTEVAWATIATPEDLLAAPGTAGRPPPHTRLGDPRRGGAAAAARLHRPHIRGPRDAVRGLHGPEQEPRARAGHADRRETSGHVDEQGRLFIDSREDDMIVSGGENVYPGQVEEVLRTHPDVADAVVMGVEDERFGQRLVAFVVPAPGQRPERGGGPALQPREPRSLQGPARGAPARRPAAQRARQGSAARIARRHGAH